MFKYIVIMMFAVGIMGSSMVAFAGTVPCTSENLECDVTIKCVCESKFGGATRVVPCPTEVSFPFEFDDEDTPVGSLEVECGAELEASCDDLEIRCKWWERSNCLVTLPVEVGCEDEE